MGLTLEESPKETASAAWQGLPPRMRVLFVTNRHRTGGWLAESLVADSQSQIELEEVVGSAAGLAQLRDESFDAVLVSHEPGELDATELIEGYRAGGADEPITVLGNQSEQEMAAPCYEVGADAYLCANTTTIRNLIWVLARAVQRHQLVRENRRLNLAEQQRLQREHDEADLLLNQQRALIADLAGIHRRGQGDQSITRPTDVSSAVDSQPAPDANQLTELDLPDELISHYRELLRTYVIMGSGNLTREMSRLADLLATAGVSARQTMQMHVHVLEELVNGLGSRSTRHVMTRADLLVLEILIHLAEGYRLRYRERVHPPAQRMLPGFEDKISQAF